MKEIHWKSGTRSAAEKTDLVAVASRLTIGELTFWLEVFRQRPLFHERSLLEAEMERRHPDGLAGPLFREPG
jgi:hypothetical protein